MFDPREILDLLESGLTENQLFDRLTGAVADEHRDASRRTRQTPRKYAPSSRADVWKVLVSVGDSANEGDAVVVLESTKMEILVHAEKSGTLSRIAEIA